MTGNARARFASALLGLGLVAWFAVPTSGAGPFSFPHRPHLSPAAVAGGSDKDCRVCHDYGKGARDAHLAGCDKCHVDGEHLEKKLSAAAPRPEFPHRQHLFVKNGSPRADVSCFSCHAMRADGDWIEYSVPTGGLGPKGLGDKGGGKFGEKTCADCHAAHETSGGLVTQDDRTGDGKACAVCHLTETSILPLKYRGDVRPSAQKPFAHADHGGAAADCASCHAGVRKSRTIWDYDATAGTAQMCAACHVGDGGKPLVSAANSTTVTKIDFSNFPHEKHLGEFSRMTCTTCHYPETDEQGRRVFPKREASPEPVGRAQLVNFKSCDVCHGHDGWAPSKPSWHVEGHGVGAWACFKCHHGNVDAKGKLAIATAPISRLRLDSVLFPGHLHPGVTSGGAPLADPTDNATGTPRACTDCHVADLPSLARGRYLPFAHDPHLPASPTTDNCLACHTTSATSRRSEDMTLFDPHLKAGPARVGAAAAAKGCFDCHVGAKELPWARVPDEIVAPQFDHAGHVNAASLIDGVKGIACTECHVASTRADYETPADVLNCTKCHAHEGDAAKIARTGPKTSQGDATKCLFCHDKVRGGADGSVDSPPRETIERKHLALGKGTQFHDKTGDCAACHVRDGAADVPYAERITKASVRTSIHEDPKLADRPFNDPKSDCTICHRTPPRGYLRSLSGR